MFRLAAALSVCATAAVAELPPQIAAGLADANPDVRLGAAVATCLAFRADPAAALAAVSAWDVVVPMGSGSGFAVFRRDEVFLSLGDDGQICSVLSNGHPTAAMDEALAAALAAAGIAPAGTGQDANGCRVLDLGDGRSFSIYDGRGDFACASDSDSNLYIYPGTP